MIYEEITAGRLIARKLGRRTIVRRSDALEDALFPWLTGRQNIELLVSVPSTRIENHPLFPTVADFIERRAYQMSFGQRRAIELFRVLLARPKTIYLDEPFNYLDDYKANTFVEYLSNCDVADLLVVTTHRNDNTLDATSDVLYFGHPPYRELDRK
jgi:ABC-type multidrug transport system ATPase subunit